MSFSSSKPPRHINSATSTGRPPRATSSATNLQQRLNSSRSMQRKRLGSASQRSTQPTKLPPLKPHLLTVKNVFGSQNTSQHSEKADIIIKALQEGCPDAFRETFRLAWREPVLVDEITGERFKVTEQRLMELSELMLQAENLKRRGEWREVYDIWRRVGEFFLDHKDTDTALYYYGKAQTVAKQSADMVLEARAYEDVGRVYARLGRLQEAMKAHEAQLSLADAHREEEETRAARKKLVFIYMEMAKQCLRSDEKARAANAQLSATTSSTLTSGSAALFGKTANNTIEDKYALTPAKSQAIKFLERAYRTAKQSEDPELQSQTACELGETYESVRDFDSAIKYQQIYLDLSEKQKNVPGMASAYKHLGKLYEMDGDVKSALKIYNRFMTYAEQSGDIRILGEACEHIGLSLNAMGKYQKAIKFFERNFQLAQASGEADWVNKARIHLGFAKGDAALKGFVNLIQSDDVDQLIRWKDKRDPHTLDTAAGQDDAQVDDSESISSLDDGEDPLQRMRHEQFGEGYYDGENAEYQQEQYGEEHGEERYQQEQYGEERGDDMNQPAQYGEETQQDYDNALREQSDEQYGEEQHTSYDEDQQHERLSEGSDDREEEHEQGGELDTDEEQHEQDGEQRDQSYEEDQFHEHQQLEVDEQDEERSHSRSSTGSNDNSYEEQQDDVQNDDAQEQYAQDEQYDDAQEQQDDEDEEQAEDNQDQYHEQDNEQHEDQDDNRSSHSSHSNQSSRSHSSDYSQEYDADPGTPQDEDNGEEL